MSSFTELVPSIVRTTVPIIVSAVVTLLGNLGIILPDDASTGLASFIGALVAAVLYIVIRWVETKYPQIGILLGYVKVPVYVDPTKTPAAQSAHLSAAISSAAKTPVR